MKTLTLLLVFASACVVEVDQGWPCDSANDCLRSEYCDSSPGDACGYQGRSGVCTDRPDACPDDWAPVCGCDGETYGNACEARAAGNDIARSGACDDECMPSDVHGSGACHLVLGWYWGGIACVPVSGCSCAGVDCDTLTETSEQCVARHDQCWQPDCDVETPCPDDEWCDFVDDGMCGAQGEGGTCRPRPDACTAAATPRVCGCDGTTYSSGCEAAVAGADVAYVGECSRTVCGGFAGFACEDGEWCDYPADAQCGAADQTGVCRERPWSCTALYAPVCGCDAHTYGNECLAHRAAVDVSHSGSCEPDGVACGGEAELPCAASDFCDLPDGSRCGAEGLCRTRPEACPEYYAPVCGCDGHTYGNRCEANGAGTEMAYSGECED